MHPVPSTLTTHRPLERALAIAGALICLVLTAILWASIGAHRAMWPLPALYFVEMAGLCLAAGLVQVLLMLLAVRLFF